MWLSVCGENASWMAVFKHQAEHVPLLTQPPYFNRWCKAVSPLQNFDTGREGKSLLKIQCSGKMGGSWSALLCLMHKHTHPFPDIELLTKCAIGSVVLVVLLLRWFSEDDCGSGVAFPLWWPVLIRASSFLMELYRVQAKTLKRNSKT